MKLKNFLIILLILANLQLVAQKLPVVIPESVNLNTVHLMNLDRVIDEAILKEEIPGAVVAIVKDNKIGYLKAFGYRQTYPEKRPMEVNTIFDLASCTKPLATAISIFILLDRGYLSLQDPVSLYLPEFRNWVEGEENVSIRISDLLTHTSGLPAYAPVGLLKSNATKLLPEVLKDYILNCNLLYKPRTDMRYSCLNYITLQYIIEKITNQSLDLFAKENIYQPLGLKDTGFIPHKNLLDRIAPTELINDSVLLQGVVHDPLARELNHGISGNAGLFSTAEDVAVLANLFLNEGVSNGVRILSPASVEKMITLPSSYDSFGRGLGWDISSAYSNNQGDLFNEDTFGHTGYTGTSIVIDKENNLSLIILTNSVHPYDNGKVARLRKLIANIVAASVGTANNVGYLNHYQERIKEFSDEKPISHKDIVLLGDSQTENGKDWAARLKNRHVRNRGVIGDNTEGVLNRIEEIVQGKPRKVILTIGVNDISQGLNVNTLIDNVAQILNEIQKGSPATKLYIQSILPINEIKCKYRLLKGKSDVLALYNKKLEELAAQMDIGFINSYSLFLEEESIDQLNPILTNDGLHVNESGYKIWSNFLKRYID